MSFDHITETIGYIALIIGFIALMLALFAGILFNIVRPNLRGTTKENLRTLANKLDRFHFLPTLLITAGAGVLLWLIARTIMSY